MCAKDGKFATEAKSLPLDLRGHLGFDLERVQTRSKLFLQGWHSRVDVAGLLTGV